MLLLLRPSQLFLRLTVIKIFKEKKFSIHIFFIFLKIKTIIKKKCHEIFFIFIKIIILRPDEIKWARLTCVNITRLKKKREKIDAAVAFFVLSPHAVKDEPKKIISHSIKKETFIDHKCLLLWLFMAFANSGVFVCTLEMRTRLLFIIFQEINIHIFDCLLYLIVIIPMKHNRIDERFLGMMTSFARAMIAEYVYKLMCEWTDSLFFF